jgi:ABC-type lipoprotein export system ATPase subunit
MVLDHVDLDVSRGEMVAILGRSGSGKSTLLHLIGGLDRADAGTITVAGIRVDRLDEPELNDLRRHRVGFVFQFFHLLPELTGRENVYLPTRLAGDGRAGRVRADQLIARLGVADVAGHLPTTMSGGEQQRLAIARALVHVPDVILADEPTGNLDQESGHAVLQLLREVADDGRAVVVVTHDGEAAQLADRVLSLRDGRLGPP